MFVTEHNVNRFGDVRQSAQRKTFANLSAGYPKVATAKVDNHYVMYAGRTVGVSA